MNKQKLLEILSKNIDVTKLSQAEIDSKCLEIETAYDEALSTLTPREQIVIKKRYGLENGKPMTLEEMANEFNVTRERIRQIEAKALRKLRHPSRSKILNNINN